MAEREPEVRSVDARFVEESGQVWALREREKACVVMFEDEGVSI